MEHIDCCYYTYVGVHVHKGGKDHAPFQIYGRIASNADFLSTCILAYCANDTLLDFNVLQKALSIENAADAAGVYDLMVQSMSILPCDLRTRS